MENITPFDLGGLAKDLDNQLIGMRSPFGPAEDRPLHEASYVGMKHAFEAWAASTRWTGTEATGFSYWAFQAKDSITIRRTEP